MRKEVTDVLILQSGSVDITNMKTTKVNIVKYKEFFKQQAVLSATNLFTTVSNAVQSNPEVQKVVIMKQTPRYDPKNNDPQAIKVELSKLYNKTLDQQWRNCPIKNRIMIGHHSLDCSGGVRDSRYRVNNKFDGVHLYGPSGRKSYTESVLKIIRDWILKLRRRYIMNL